MVGMSAGLAVNLYVKFVETSIAWTWYVLIGTSVTFFVAVLVSIVLDRKEANG